MTYKGLTQKSTVLDEKTLQNVAFVMLLLRVRHHVWLAPGLKRVQLFCQRAGTKSPAHVPGDYGYLVFKERVARAKKSEPST